MNISIPLTTIILSWAFLASAETVSLKGTVTKTGVTTGIAGVKVSLVKLPNISTTTGADGAFFLSGPTASVKLRNESNDRIRFMIKGNTVVFSPVSNGIPVTVTVFGSDGRIKSSGKLHDISTGKRSITLPRFSPGFNIMKVTVGPESFTRTIVCVGDNLMMKNKVSNGKKDDGLILTKQLTARAVDTLKAEKDGYLVKKIAIDKYSIDNIAIALDTNGGGYPGACTREVLKGIADSYIAAQKAGDPSKMPLATEVKYLQNNMTVTADKSICKTAMPVDNSITFCDVDSCRAFVEIISSTGGTPWVLIAWLKVENGKISAIDAMVTTKGDFVFDAKAYLDYTKEQDWSVLTSTQQSSRQTLIRGGDAYLDMFKAGVDSVPWGTPCARVEGGARYISPDCSSGMPGKGGITATITNRRYAVDVDMGTVDIFCTFMSMPDSHMFRFIDGKLRLVHTQTVQNK